MRHIAKLDSRRFLSIKRARRFEKRSRTARKLARARTRSQHFNEAKRRTFGSTSLVCKMLADSHTKEYRITGRSIEIRAPKVFSIMDNPEGVLQTICVLAKADNEHKLERIHLDFEQIQNQDLAAQALIAKLVDEIDVSAKLSRRFPVQWSGIYPKDQAHCRLLKATGVIKQLRVKHEYLSPQEESKLTLFVRHCRHYIAAIKPMDADEKSKASEKFADYINRCLASTGKRLTDSARHLLCSRIGELLGNAEEHAGMVDWTIKGYLDTSLPTPMCEFVIFNFGKSLAESFHDLKDGSYTMDQIRPYMEKHSKRGFFNRSWRSEDLLTVMALQQGVSSKNTGPNTTRGNGMTDLIVFFQRINDELVKDRESGAKMTIISGDTRVLFDGTYKTRTGEAQVHQMKAARAGLIAFNPENDLMQPPDPKYVKPLDGVMLPGTLISVQFVVPTSSLVSLESPEND